MKGVEKRPNITNLASKKPNWQPCWKCEKTSYAAEVSTDQDWIGLDQD